MPVTPVPLCPCVAEGVRSVVALGALLRRRIADAKAGASPSHPARRGIAYTIEGGLRALIERRLLTREGVGLRFRGGPYIVDFLRSVGHPPSARARCRNRGDRRTRNLRDIIDFHEQVFPVCLSRARPYLLASAAQLIPPLRHRQGNGDMAMGPSTLTPRTASYDAPKKDLLRNGRIPPLGHCPRGCMAWISEAGAWPTAIRPTAEGR